MDNEKPGIFRQLYFSATLHYQMAVGYDHWNVILGDTSNDPLGLLILGALPITNTSIIPSSALPHGGNHDEILIQLCASKNKPLKKIVSVVQDFELSGNYTLTYPVQTEDWQNHNINHIKQKMPDNGFNLPFLTLENIIDDIHLIRTQGESCYVHCKAGRGRSWTIIMAYLLKYTNFNTVELAKAHIKLIRDQVSPSQEQIEYIKNFMKHLTVPVDKTQRNNISY